MQLTAQTADDFWRGGLFALYNDGVVTRPRDINTKELLFHSDTFDMNCPICYHQDRKLSYKFMAAEAYFIAHGDNRTANLVQYNQNMAKFSDDGYIFNGAYGPPFNEQLMYVVNTLVRDINSRQAVLTIWKPNPVTSVDHMCTIAMQFLVRNNTLHCKVTMRSSDVWLGIPYDVFNFTIMTLRVLTLLNKWQKVPIELGIMHWSAGSFHMYDSDIVKVQKVLLNEPEKVGSRVPSRALTDWLFVVDSLIACRDGDNDSVRIHNLWKIRP